ncbi:hypothetical protein JAB6_29370 [Janthinobacterium sp. HH104]|nr:hypothetical protein JAB6_29370 [Janthinobacterium sp. HH104]
MSDFPIPTTPNIIKNTTSTRIKVIRVLPEVINIVAAEGVSVDVKNVVKHRQPGSWVKLQFGNCQIVRHCISRIIYDSDSRECSSNRSGSGSKFLAFREALSCLKRCFSLDRIFTRQTLGDDQPHLQVTAHFIHQRQRHIFRPQIEFLAHKFCERIPSSVAEKPFPSLASNGLFQRIVNHIHQRQRHHEYNASTDKTEKHVGDSHQHQRHENSSLAQLFVRQSIVRSLRHGNRVPVCNVLFGEDQIGRQLQITNWHEFGARVAVSWEKIFIHDGGVKFLAPFLRACD